MQVNKVDKLVPTVYNEVRAACVKVVLRKWKNVGGDGPTRREGKGTGGYDTVMMTGVSGRTGCDGDPSRRRNKVMSRTRGRVVRESSTK
jgi:hypothetical protein